MLVSYRGAWVYAVPCLANFWLRFVLLAQLQIRQRGDARIDAVFCQYFIGRKRPTQTNSFESCGVLTDPAVTLSFVVFKSADVVIFAFASIGKIAVPLAFFFGALQLALQPT